VVVPTDPEPDQQQSCDDGGSGRPRRGAESGAGEVYDRFQRLPPIPASGESDSGLRGELGELLKQVAEDRFGLFGRGE
jgi:hypothetical protein